MHPLPDSWDCKDSGGREWGVDQSAVLAAHVPSLSPAQISTQARGASPDRPSPTQFSFQTFVPFCPATGVLWPLPGHIFLPLREALSRAVWGGLLGWGLLTRLCAGPLPAWWA